MELFLDTKTPTFEKIAADVQLPEDPNQWPHEILQELHKQVSYISDFDPRIVMDRVDAEKGYGFGHFEVATKMSDPNANAQDKQNSGQRTARIPIVIEEGRLKPFDIVINQESKATPLTEERLRQAMFRPHMFDTAKKGPGDQGIVERLYPPFQDSNRMGGVSGGGNEGMVVQSEAGAAKEDNVKEASIGKALVGAQTRAQVVRGAKKPRFTGRTNYVRPVPIKKPGAIDKLKDFFGMGKSAMAKTAEQEFNDFVSGDPGESKDNSFEAWDGTKIETAGEMDQRRRVRAEGDLEQVQQMGEGAWGKVLSDQNRQAMGMPLRGPIEGTNSKSKYDKRQAELHSIAGGKMKTAAKMMKLKTPEPEKIIEGQKADGHNGQYSGTMQPDGSIKQASLISIILPTITKGQFEKVAEALTEEVQVSLLKNTPAAELVGTLCEWEETKTASAADFVRSDVAQLRRNGRDYSVKYAASRYWEPRTVTMDRGAAYEAFGDLVTQADMRGSVTMVKGAKVSEDTAIPDAPEPIESFGMYKVQTTDGKSLIGFAIPNLIDLDGTVLPMVLFTNGSASAVQGDMVGVRSGGEPNLPDGPAHGHGSFIHITNSGKAEATVPLEILSSVGGGTEGTWAAEAFGGDKVIIKMQPGVGKPMRVDNTVIIPDSYRWMPLSGDPVSIVDVPEAFGKLASARRGLLEVLIRGADGCFSFEGLPLDKLAYDSTQFLDVDDAAFILGGLGIEAKYAMKKLGEANYSSAPVTVHVGRTIKTAAMREEQGMVAATRTLSNFPKFELLLKEAAAIPDPTAVDTVLSIGFINPENIMDFVNALPRIEESQQRMCELLLASRLGLKEVSEGSLEKSIRATEDVLEGLKVLAFQEA